MEPARDQVCEGLTADGLKEQPQGELKQLFETRAEGDDSELFKTRAWWEDLLKKDCGDRCEVTVEEAECFDTAWQEWFDTGHEFGIRDREFPGKGLDRILDFVLICVRKKTAPAIITGRKNASFIGTIVYEDDRQVAVSVADGKML